MTKSAQTDIGITPHDILTAHMDEHKMRKTPERYAILDVVMATKGHYSADQILAMMPDDFHVSRGSIYNTLRLLEECGLVVAHQIDGATLYEKTYGVKPHHHYICTSCNKIWDLRNEQIGQEAMRVSTPRFKKSRCSIYIYGMCNVCLAKIARMKKKMERDRLKAERDKHKRTN